MRPAQASTSRRGISVRLLRVLGLMTATIFVAPVGAQPAAAAPPSALQACAAVVADAERLACYDRLAGRVRPSVAVASGPGADGYGEPDPRRTGRCRRSLHHARARPRADGTLAETVFRVL